MQPNIWCDFATVARNARAWADFTGVPVRAVLKADGYRWGAAELARALEPICPAFCVADADELFALRAVTTKPIVMLGAIDPRVLAAALDAGALPTIETWDEIEIAARWARARERRLRLRVGVRGAAGWSGVAPAALRELGAAFAAHGVEVEAWTHVTAANALDEQVERLREGVATLRASGANVVATDAASSFPAASRGALGESVRIGIGLFGATGSAAVPGVRNALRIEAPVVRSERIAVGALVGYGAARMERSGTMLSVRCGYADGYPSALAGTPPVLAVGMQYAHLPADEAIGDAVELLNAQSDLDRLAAASNRPVHEFVTTLGLARTTPPPRTEE